MPATLQKRTIVRERTVITASSPVALLLALAFPGRHAPKRIARLAECSERAAQYYQAGAKDMSARRLLALMARSEAMEAHVLALIKSERERNAGQNGDRHRMASVERGAERGDGAGRATVALDGTGACSRAAAAGVTR